MSIPTRLKPFVPSGPDYTLARDFFARLGFAENWANDEFCELQCGDVVFLLQNFHNREMQENLMMHLEVTDLDGYWAMVQSSGILEMEGVRGKPPTTFPWGATEVHLIDPAGVCWHIAQAPAAG